MRASFHGEHLKISELTKPLYFQSSWFRIVALEFSSKSRMGSPKFTPKSPSTEKAQQNRDLGDDLILVVEDDPDTRMLLSFLLSRRGYQVLEAENGRRALEKLEIQKPRLVLTDLQMAVMNGIELVENIRASAGLQSLPVIVMTAYASQLCEKAMELGANDFIQKPIEVETLVQKIEHLLGKT